MKTIVLLLALSSFSVADPGRHEKKVKLHGKPKHSGEGCPAGSVEAIPLPDGEGVTLLFSKWGLAITKEDQDKNIKNKQSRCNIVIPLEVPPGQRLTALQVDYSGYVSLPKDAKISLKNKYEFLVEGAKHGTSLNADADRLKGPQEGDFYFQDILQEMKKIKSPCGLNADMTVQSQLQLSNNNLKVAASITVDAVNAATQKSLALNYRWKTESCVPDEGGRRHPREFDFASETEEDFFFYSDAEQN